MKWELRDYDSADFEQLWRLDQACFSPAIAYSRAELAHYLGSPNATCLLAVKGKQTLGFIVGHHARQYLGHIVTLDVDASARRSGLGSVLITALEARLSGQGCRSVVLEVAVDNHAAIAFYKKHRYAVLKTLSRYYPAELDGLMMGKTLSANENPL